MEVGATFTPRNNNSNRFCCVYGCTSLARRNPEIKFAKFPKITDAVRRKKMDQCSENGKKSYRFYVCLFFTIQTR